MSAVRDPTTSTLIVTGMGGGHHDPRTATALLRDRRRVPEPDFVVEVVDRECPITSELAAWFSQVPDDFLCDPRRNPHAAAWGVATVDEGTSTALHPVTWPVHYGYGRVFISSFGRGAEAIGGAGFSSLFLRGAERAAAGEVTIAPGPGSERRR